MRIFLSPNPIVCKLSEVRWFLAYENRTKLDFPIKKINCLNYNDKELIFMTENDFEEFWVNYTSTQSKDTSPLVITILPTTLDEIDKSLKGWHFILLFFGLLFLISIFVACAFYFKRKFQKQIDQGNTNFFEPDPVPLVPSRPSLTLINNV